MTLNCVSFFIQLNRMEKEICDIKKIIKKPRPKNKTVISGDLIGFGFSNCFLKVTIVSKQNQWHLFKVTGVSVHRPILRWIQNFVHLLIKMTTELMNLCATSISNHSTISTVQKIWIWILGHVRRNSIAICMFWSWYMTFIQWTRYRAHANVCVCVKYR